MARTFKQFVVFGVQYNHEQEEFNIAAGNDFDCYRTMTEGKVDSLFMGKVKGSSVYDRSIALQIMNYHNALVNDAKNLLIKFEITVLVDEETLTFGRITAIHHVKSVLQERGIAWHSTSTTRR